ncbi:MAG: hypothetical protein IT381_25350 [Deltaproteobacteria bacterium]|nr:hypothetical protein [Deltaproteobacteria bacterium]
MHTFLLALSLVAPAPAPFYEGDDPPIAKALQLEDKQLTSILTNQLKTRNVTVKNVLSGATDIAGMTHLERAALLAAASSQPGNENDMMLEADGQFTPVETRWDGDVISFRIGAPKKSLYGEGPSAAELQTKYGVGPFVEAGSKWTKEMLWLVDAALATLAKDELAGVAGLPFHIMEKDPSNKAVRGRSVAMYRQEPTGTQIELYALALESDKRKFVGSVDHPVPNSVSMLVHELAHAISRKTHRDAQAAYAPQKAAYDALAAKAVEMQKAASARLDEYRKTKDEALKKAVDEDNAALKKMQQELNTASKNMAALGAAQRQGGAQPSPVEKAFLAKLPLPKSPTAYGRTLPGESFAECFRLAKLDPAALERAAPGIPAFFASAEYKEAIAAPLK